MQQSYYPYPQQQNQMKFSQYGQQFQGVRQPFQQMDNNPNSQQKPIQNQNTNQNQNVRQSQLQYPIQQQLQNQQPISQIKQASNQSNSKSQQQSETYQSQLINQLQQRQPQQQNDGKQQNFYANQSQQQNGSKSQLHNQYVQTYQVSNPQKQSMYQENSKKPIEPQQISAVKNQVDKRPQLEQQIIQRNSRFIEDNFLAQQQKVLKVQQNLMSPKTMNNPHQDNSMLFHSPAPRTNDQKVVYLQSPATIQNGGFKLKQQSVQAQGQTTNVNFTTTAAIQNELAQQKDKNNKLLQKIQQIESDISRGMSVEFLQELESKIAMLSQLNHKLQNENQGILQIIDTSSLKDQVNKLNLQKKTLENKIESTKASLPELDQRQHKLDQKLQELSQSEGFQIRELVNELENKVQGLIVENERLTQLLKEKETNDDKKFNQELRNLKLEVEKIQLQYQNQKFDEDNLKAKCKELERKYNQAKKDTSENIEKEWQSKISDLEEKVTLLIEENEKLNSALNDPENTQTDINDLEDRIRIIIQNNQKMTSQIEEYKKKAKKQ